MRDQDGVIRHTPETSLSSLCPGPSCHRLRVGAPSSEDHTPGLGQLEAPSSVMLQFHSMNGCQPEKTVSGTSTKRVEPNILPATERSGPMAPQPPPNIRLADQQHEAIHVCELPSDTSGEAGWHYGDGEDHPLNEPLLFHKVKNQKSILAIVISDSKIFAGTQGGEILVWLRA